MKKQEQNTIKINLYASSFVLPEVLDFISIGELHGSRQNALVVLEMVKQLSKHFAAITVAFEWELTSGEIRALRSYIHGGIKPKHIPKFFGNSDGRFTLEHTKLLKWIRRYNSSHKKQIDILTFALNEQGYSASEVQMTQFLDIYKKKHPKTLVCIETGNYHGRMISKNVKNQSLMTRLAHRFSVFSVFVKYQDGTIAIDSNVYDVTQAASQRASFEKLFNATITIPHSEAAQDISNLTKIEQCL